MLLGHVTFLGCYGDILRTGLLDGVRLSTIPGVEAKSHKPDRVLTHGSGTGPDCIVYSRADP